MSSLIGSNVRAYRRRYNAVIAAIAIGVAFLTATLLVSSTVRATLGASIGQDYSRADLVATVGDPNEGTTAKVSPAKTVQSLKAIAGVDHVLATTTGYLEAGGGSTSSGLAVTVTAGDADLLGQPLTQGSAASTGTATLSKSAAKSLHAKIGDTVPLRGFDTDGKSIKATVKVSGLRADSASPLSAGMPQIQLDATTAKTLGMQTTASDVMITTKAGAAGVTDKVATQLKQLGYPAPTVQTPDEKTNATVKDFTGGTDILTWVLGLFAAIALVVTTLVVSNTFAVVLAQRTRELALLRTLGAKRGQVKRMVIGESLLIGLIGSVIGVVVAVLVLWGGCAALGPLLHFPYLTFGMNWTGVVAGVVVGLVVTLLASLRPANAATRVAPLAALRPQETVTARSKRGRGRIVVGSVLAVLGALMLVAGVLGAFGVIMSLMVAFLGGLLSFIGVLMLGTFLIPWAVRMLAQPFGSKVSGKLAGLNALRHPQRTSAIGTALLLGVTLVCMMAAGASSARSTLNNELASHYPVDLVVSSASKLGGNTANDKGLTQEKAKAVGSVDGVAQAELAAPVAVGGSCETSSAPVSVTDSGCVVVQAMGARQMSQVLTEGAKTPATGTVAVGADTYSGKAPTSVNIVDASGTKHRVKVDPDAPAADSGGYVMTQQTAKGLGLTSPSRHQEKLAQSSPSIWIKANDDAQASDLVKNVSRAAGVDQSSVDGALPIRQAMSQVIDAMLMIVSALLAVAVVIALIGVSNTLSLSVIERTRENSLLRALGLKKRQLRGMLALEAGLIAGAAAVLGLILGTIYGAAGAKSALLSLGAFSLGIPWMWLLVVLVVAVGAAVLASVWPARRAAKLSPVEGLAME
jgi:putative ABC transport system permease protein